MSELCGLRTARTVHACRSEDGANNSQGDYAQLSSLIFMRVTARQREKSPSEQQSFDLQTKRRRSATRLEAPVSYCTGLPRYQIRIVRGERLRCPLKLRDSVSLTPPF